MISKGPYIGIVQANDDPMQLGRVKVSVAQVFGVGSSELGSIGVNDLPWALPFGLPAGGSNTSGGFDWLPDPGDQVVVWFIDGEPEKPIYAWCMQTTSQAKDFELHKYYNKLPSRGAFTRYGHTIELNPQDVLITTKSGYQVFLLNGDSSSYDGQIQINTPRGQYIILDDQTNGAQVNVNQDLSINAGKTITTISDDVDCTTLKGDFKILSAKNFRVETDNNIQFTVDNDWTSTVSNNYNLTVTGDVKESSNNYSIATSEDYTLNSTSKISLYSSSDFSIRSTGQTSIQSTGQMDVSITNNLNVSAVGNIALSFARLSLGAGSSEPYVLGNQLVNFVEALINWLDTHTHSNGNNGSPTGPAIKPSSSSLSPKVTPLLSKTIVGE